MAMNAARTGAPWSIGAVEESKAQALLPDSAVARTLIEECTPLPCERRCRHGWWVMEPIDEKLWRCPLFDGFDTAQLRKVVHAGHVRTYAPGRVVFRAGEPGDDLYVVLTGEAKVLGKRHARTLGPGDYFGEMALLDGGLRSATIAALTEVSTLVLSRSAVTELIQVEPRFAMVMATVLSWRTRRMERASESGSLFG